jgi:hypothetical protein
VAKLWRSECRLTRFLMPAASAVSWNRRLSWRVVALSTRYRPGQSPAVAADKYGGMGPLDRKGIDRVAGHAIMPTGWWGRCNQQAPKGDWRTWLLLAGRGFGKTRSGAECIRDQVIHHRRRRIAIRADKAQADLAERGHCDNLQRRRAGAPAGAATRCGVV